MTNLNALNNTKIYKALEAGAHDVIINSVELVVDTHNTPTGVVIHFTPTSQAGNVQHLPLKLEAVVKTGDGQEFIIEEVKQFATNLVNQLGLPSGLGLGEILEASTDHVVTLHVKKFTRTDGTVGTVWTHRPVATATTAGPSII
jgi:hypothetical protein